jgi:hypothetical protein
MICMALSLIEKVIMTSMEYRYMGSLLPEVANPCQGDTVHALPVW